MSSITVYGMMYEEYLVNLNSLQEDSICELEMRLSAKQAEHDSVRERLTNSDMMVIKLKFNLPLIL